MQVRTINYFEFTKLEKEKLDLTSQNITDADIPGIISFLNEHPEIKSLNLPGNDIGNVGAQHLAGNTTITSLNLFANRIDDVGAEHLAQNTTLISLNLCWNNIRDLGAQHLAQNTTLTSLNLSYNNIGDVGAEHLAQNTTLISLNLCWNNIGNLGKQALAETNPQKRLNYLKKEGYRVTSLQRMCLFAITDGIEKKNPLFLDFNPSDLTEMLQDIYNEKKNFILKL